MRRGWGLERNGLPHRSARHHVLLLIFCFPFSPSFVVVLIASHSTQHTLQAVTQDTKLPPRGSCALPFHPILDFPLCSHLRGADTRHSVHVYKTALRLLLIEEGVDLSAYYSLHPHLVFSFISR
jgi:hypothetical protein